MSFSRSDRLTKEQMPKRLLNHRDFQAFQRRHWHDEEEILPVRSTESYRENIVRAEQPPGRALDVECILKPIRKYCRPNQEQNDPSDTEHDSGMQARSRTWTCQQKSKTERDRPFVKTSSQNLCIIPHVMQQVENEIQANYKTSRPNWNIRKKSNDETCVNDIS